MSGHFDAEPMRTWEADGFRLEMYETGNVHPQTRHTTVAYRLYDEQAPDPTVPVFEAADYGVPSQRSIDGDGAVAALLHFLSLRPGDTDPDYFEAYTTRQQQWMEARAEALDLAATTAFTDYLHIP